MPESTDNIQKEKSKAPSWMNRLLLRFTPISLTDRLFFVQHVGVMLKAGITITETLESLMKESKNERLRSILRHMIKDIKEGKSFGSALEEYQSIFGELFVNMVKSGELSGKLETVLHELYEQLKKEHELMSKVRGAMIYPIIVIIIMLGIGVSMVVFVIPNLTDVFKDVNAELPLATRMLIMTSDTLLAHGLSVSVAALVLLFAFVRLIRTTNGKSIFHRLLLFSPVTGTIIKRINIARFARTLGTLLTTDIPIESAIDITARVLGNVHYRALFFQSLPRIKQGTPLGNILEEHASLIPPTVTQMIRVGEKTGTLDTMLLDVATFYENDVKKTMENLPAVIEPLLMVILGVGVAGLAVAIIMPMYSLAQQF